MEICDASFDPKTSVYGIGLNRGVRTAMKELGGDKAYHRAMVCALSGDVVGLLRWAKRQKGRALPKRRTKTI